ncbi:hypothetical protein [Hansschlegelia sp.]|uniref:hypothetical protein n=1 Tax=Hansschlegelia sp. TaxID=2041892 RepID=UPI002B9FF5E4|nr:hypothetical protein [Hansschlegelia sp.]HVI28791.1 hypothetical protein [Hansschlegelia sp.]
MRLRRDFFPDLFFQSSTTDDPLRIRLLDEPIKVVRFELSEAGTLHLGSMSLEDADGNLSDLSKAALHTSSVYPGTEKALNARLFFEKQWARVGFHTKKDQSPWAEARLAAPGTYRRLIVNNRGGKWAARAWALRVKVQTADAQWREVYDHQARRRMFEDVLSASVGGYPATCHQAIAALDRIVLEALAGEFRGMKRNLRAEPGVSRQAKADIRKVVNDQILLPREVEWTTHGVTRSFRFWSAEEKVEYLKDANQLVADLRDITPDVCLGFGSVLSIVRDRDLIPHDDDLDIIIAFPKSVAAKFSEGLKIVSEHLSARGYSVKGNYVSHRHVSLRGAKAVDVFVGVYEEGERVTWFPGPRAVFSRSDVFPPVDVPLFEVPCAVPRNPFLYLEKIYGPDWAVPKPRWHHKWDRASIADLL